MPIVETELNIGKSIVELVEKPEVYLREYTPKYNKVYRITWTSNNKYHSEYITRNTMEKLVKSGHVKYCKMSSNYMSDEYLSCECKVKELDEYDIYGIIKNFNVINATNEFSDITFPKMKVTTLIFGNDNLLKAGIIEYKDKEYRCTIDEIIKRSKTVFYDAYADTYRPAFSIGNSMKVFATREEIKKEQKLGYSVQLGSMFGQSFFKIPLNKSLNLKTAEKYLSDRYKIVIEHDDTFDEINKLFNDYIRKAIGKREIKVTDNIECLYYVTYPNYRANATNKIELYVFNDISTNKRFILDGSKYFTSSFLKRNFNKENITPKKKIDFDCYIGKEYCDTSYNSANNSLIVDFDFKRA